MHLFVIPGVAGRSGSGGLFLVPACEQNSEIGSGSPRAEYVVAADAARLAHILNATFEASYDVDSLMAACTSKVGSSSMGASCWAEGVMRAIGPMLLGCGAYRVTSDSTQWRFSGGEFSPGVSAWHSTALLSGARVMFSSLRVSRDSSSSAVVVGSETQARSSVFERLRGVLSEMSIEWLEDEIPIVRSQDELFALMARPGF